MQEENSEKMVLISSVCNLWTLERRNISKSNLQNNRNMASVAAAPPPARAAAAMDQKAAVAAFSPGFIQQQQSNQHSKQQQQEQNNGNGQQQEALRCPRCDSSNTKFCYYNNYSLSQPRHFCKACKRYWTRGGTLRSVPVGGGCRKNKRVRRHPNNNNNTSSTTNNTSSNNNINLREGSVNSLPVVGSGHPIHDLMISSPTNNNPLYYGSNNHNLMNFPFSRYDLQIPPPPPQMNGFGLGFSSSGLVHNINGDEVNFRNLHNNNNSNNNNNNNNNNKQIFQDLISTTTTPPTISSFLASTFQMKGGGGGNNNFETIMPSYDEGSDGIYTKEEVVKTEVEGQNGSSLDHDPQEWCGSSRNGQMDHQQQMGGSSPSCDPSLIWGSGPNLGAWLDPSTNNNLSSSLTSLI